MTARAAAEAKVYFEDLVLGVPFETPAITLTETHVALFTGLVGERPADSHAVPALLPLCMSSGLGWRVPQPPLAVLAFMGFEWKFLKRARVGDTIRSVSTALTKRGLKEGGVLIEERSIINQRGELVQEGETEQLVRRRATSPP